MSGPTSARATCERLRSLVQDCISKHLYQGAVFFADKLVALSDSAPADVYLLAQARAGAGESFGGPRPAAHPAHAQAHYVSKEYRRALTLLNKHALFERNIRFRYLAAKCLVECHEWEECLALLGPEDAADALRAKVRGLGKQGGGRAQESESNSMRAQEEADNKTGAEVSMFAVVSVLRGRVYEALENRQRAVKCYR